MVDGSRRSQGKHQNYSLVFLVAPWFFLPTILSQVLDTKDLVLKTLLAHLQIRGLAREVTSYFETADVGLSDAGRALLEDGTEETSGGLKTE